MVESNIVDKIPLLKTKAGPKDKNWPDRLKEEFLALIQYVKLNQEDDNEWFEVNPDESGLKWKGKCWYFYNYDKYEFILQFEVILTYLDPSKLSR